MVSRQSQSDSMLPASASSPAGPVTHRFSSMSEHTTGVPLAMASSRALLIPSCRLGRTNASHS